MLAFAEGGELISILKYEPCLMGKWRLEWSECDLSQCWAELLDIWNSGEFRGWLMRRQRIARP